MEIIIDFFDRHPVIKVVAAVVMLIILFFSCIKAGKHIGDAIWG